ncbi:hypothetical protein EHS25_005057 [Saitozyma podzolica]|uniref:Oxo-4-hydroxy-4-carboxy-5-ureidoimidazoline decarboxylase domain-containing protein n=1 Tax=Saitozyma podzolica TaxID=1890683 RepID=A0A427Y2E3_9TREE|nr:hypothetical protein EHS25_005057 [Saitozyma podzolica]
MSDPAPPSLALEDSRNADSLTHLLSTLFEPSPPLHSLLVPSVLLRLTATTTPPPSYSALIDLGHPMIGEQKAVSKLSGKEQGAGPVTPKVVLDRLAHLNQVYCAIYPGLRFITFVAGRPRSAIIPEIEQTCDLPLSPQPLPEDFAVDEPKLDSDEVARRIRDPNGEAWKRECERGLEDVWRIGKARLGTLALE